MYGGHGPVSDTTRPDPDSVRARVEGLRGEIVAVRIKVPSTK